MQESLNKNILAATRCHFGGGGKQEVPKPTKPPTLAEASDASATAAKKKPRGFASTVLTGGLGDTSPVATATKTLLGQ